MGPAKRGDTVKAYYVSKLANGAIFDTNVDSEPLQFTIGAGMVIRGYEQAVIGMKPGEYKRIFISEDKAYGPRLEDMILVIARKQFPSNQKPEVGQRVEIGEPDGPITTVMVTDVSESSVTLDGNHPLAGKSLIFDIQLIEII